MKTYKAKAKEWLNDFTGDEVSGEEFRGAYEFAKWLDQEAQDEPCKCLCDGCMAKKLDDFVLKSIEKPCDHGDSQNILSHPGKCMRCGFSTTDKPQQPKEIEELDSDTLYSELERKHSESELEIRRKLNEVIRTLNRLIHKD